MAKDGRKSSPSLTYTLFNGTISNSPLPPGQLGLVVLIGFALIGISFFAKANQKELVIGGIGIIAIGFLGYIVLMILIFVLSILKRKATITTSSDSSGTGYDGGSSDGSGGATGTW